MLNSKSEINILQPFEQDIYTLLSPVSELVLGNVANSELLFGRHGSDTIYGYIFNEDNIQLNDIDILFGDFFDITTTDIEILITLNETGNPLGILDFAPIDGFEDVFVLGDWSTPYYENPGDPLDLLSSNFLGFNELSILYDFNPNQDTIRLNGSAEDYFILEINDLFIPEFGINLFGEALFSISNGIPDIVSFIISPPDISLDLNEDYFEFVNRPPARERLKGVTQFGTQGVDLGIHSAVDSHGNVYVTGITSGSLGGKNQGSFDVYVTKYNRFGKVEWVKQFGSSQVDFVGAIQTDPDGNIILSGFTAGDLFEPRDSEINDVWITKMSPSGEFLWSEQFGESVTGGFITGSLALDVDDSGNSVLAGIAVKEQTRPDLFDFPVQDDSWARKFNSQGGQEWFTNIGPTTELGSAFFDEAYGVSTDSNGNVFVGGWTQGVNSPSDPSLVVEGVARYDALLSKLNSDGEVQWIEQIGSVDDGIEFAWDVVTDSKDNVYITGYTYGSLGGPNKGFADIFLAKYDTDGNQIWIEQFGSEDDEGTYLLNITIDNKDNIYLTGNTNGNLGGKNSGSFDAWVSKFSSNGRQRWTRQFGTSKLDYATSVTFDGKRSLVVTGFTEGSIRRQENKGAIDSWVASLNVRNGALRNKFKPIKSRVNPRSSGATATDSLTSLATEIDASDRPLEVSSSGGNPLPSDATSVISNSLEGFGKKIVDPLETLVTERFRGSSFPSMNNLLIDNNELNPQEISNDFSSLSATTLDIDLI